MMPAVPNRIRDQILYGEFIDFATLLPQAMFTDGHMEPAKLSTDANEPLSYSPRRITKFAIWWNVYISIMLLQSPERALEMIALVIGV